MALAQLYKMTLYICDLEENLSINEIKCLIKDDALDGISISCVTHFADEKVGAKVEWDDDIDINNKELIKLHDEQEKHTNDVGCAISQDCSMMGCYRYIICDFPEKKQ